jgi:tetratricopeptide (TPR) repeat protein
VIIRSLFYILLIPILVSCSHVNNAQSSKGRRTTPVTNQQYHAKKQIDISVHDPQKGIDDYEAERGKHPHDQALTRDYIKDLEDLRTSADAASERGNLAQAGRIYSVLLKNHHEFPKRLSFSKDYLNTKLTYCKTTLSRKGFEEYRKGNLNEAIGYWQGYLNLDPNNPDIKKAVQTASAQQKNLEQKR